jgi:hypothetical protein
MTSSGTLRRVALVRTDVSEELRTSIIRVTGIDELGTTLLQVWASHSILSENFVRGPFAAMKLPSCKLGNAGQAVEQVENKTWQPKGRSPPFTPHSFAHSLSLSLSLSLSVSCTIEFRNVDLLILIKLNKGLVFYRARLGLCQVLVCADAIEIFASVY